MRVYSNYLDLDVDHNGMLNKLELIAYGSGSLTNVFINRVFQECHTYENEMDYKTFLDFVLAMENKKEQPALQYFWRLLDTNKSGFIDVFTINYFFREIVERYPAEGFEPVSVEDVNDEIFDMVKPSDPYGITFEDLMQCG
jgi:Ca2+-binding EF-hand superfamily protein